MDKNYGTPFFDNENEEPIIETPIAAEPPVEVPIAEEPIAEEPIPTPMPISEEIIVKPQPVEEPIAAQPQEPFYTETIKNETRRRTSGKFRRAVALTVIASLLGGGALGMGIGAGTQIADQYFIPRLMDDKAQANAFTFDNQSQSQPQGEQAMEVFAGGGVGNSYAALVEAVEPSVVNISAAVAREQSFGGFSVPQAGEVAGSGILFAETDTKYYVVTNNHVITSAQAVFVSINGQEGVAASPVGGDAVNDLAVISILKADVIKAGIQNVVVAKFGDSDTVRVGDEVLAIGNALGEGNTATNGIISAPAKDVAIQDRLMKLLQTNAAINEGNSGGPLVNMRGEVIGINTAKLASSSIEGMGFAIPSNVAKPIIEGLMQAKPMLGVEINNISAEMASHLNLPQAGVIIVGLVADAPAERAGLQINDIITGVNDEPVLTAEQLQEAVRRHKAGDTVKVKVIRVVDGTNEFLTISVKLEELNASRF